MPTVDYLKHYPNFHKVYMAAAGESEFPPHFHFWCCLALVGAALGREVYMHTWDPEQGEKKTFANLFVLLLGESGSGKNVAVDNMLTVANGFEEELGTYRGELSSMGLIDMIGEKIPRGKKMAEVSESKPLFLLAPELREAVATDEMAARLIPKLTELFSATGQIVQDAKRAAGFTAVVFPYVSTLLGTNEEWLVKAIPPDVLKGGYCARLFVIPGVRESSKRIRYPIFPKDRKAMLTYLRHRLYVLCRKKGEVKVSPEAAEYLEVWYKSRPEPVAEELKSLWYRHPELVDKLCMILAACEEDREALIVSREHAEQAVSLINDVFSYSRQFLNLVLRTQRTTCAYRVEKLLQAHGQLRWAVLCQRLSREFPAKEVREAVSSLQQQERVTSGIEIGETGRSHEVMIWRGLTLSRPFEGPDGPTFMV